MAKPPMGRETQISTAHAHFGRYRGVPRLALSATRQKTSKASADRDEHDQGDRDEDRVDDRHKHATLATR